MTLQIDAPLAEPPAILPEPSPPPATLLRQPAVKKSAARQAEVETAVTVSGLSVYYGLFRAIHHVGLSIRRHAVTAIIGPSGCGKSTFLRTLNRMHELTPAARVEGSVLLDGIDIMAPDVDPVQLRRVVGMVFQRPNPFPTMSIYDNVTAGLPPPRRDKSTPPRGVAERPPLRAP